MVDAEERAARSMGDRDNTFPFLRRCVIVSRELCRATRPFSLREKAARKLHHTRPNLVGCTHRAVVSRFIDSLCSVPLYRFDEPPGRMRKAPLARVPDVQAQLALFDCSLDCLFFACGWCCRLVYQRPVCRPSSSSSATLLRRTYVRDVVFASGRRFATQSAGAFHVECGTSSIPPLCCDTRSCCLAPTAGRSCWQRVQFSQERGKELHTYL